MSARAYEVTANAVFWFPVAWMVLLFVCAATSTRWPRIWAAVVPPTFFAQLVFGGCPLVILENRLRRAGGADQLQFGSLTVRLLDCVGIPAQPWHIPVALGIVFVAGLVGYRRAVRPQPGSAAEGPP